ncbi:septum formation inhibitor Maf [Hyunsoonleella flava]|uniref:Septum formation inhibitor Maf n=1 Tax=Hyunsoonleella flava TaxID=2527939 RepID=A0A4Q9FIL9_9FLAO|nr:septum formation inhibitor Maf [Hyunsoonleella flava]TBN06881.1 septum formation inhibitor Maf [Hyunsoonleella flava]
MKAISSCTVIILGLLITCFGCKEESTKKDTLAINSSNQNAKPAQPLSQQFKDYWYAGKAEISSYKLEQARYGEMRDGTAVLIYVTEDFLPEIQVKADHKSDKNIPVLKLNATKNFNTGIYPYSIMQSTFYPVGNNQHAIKVSSSMQEWCGHVYAQLNNKDNFEIMSHSYFEGEADQNFKLDKAILENELWTQLRINPKSLPTGNIAVIPSLEFTRMKHIDIKPYQADATLTGDTYTLKYNNLNRSLIITFNPMFPYDILGWEETFQSGSQTMTTKATKLNTITSPYWQKNQNKHEVLRDSLKLN